MAANSVVQKIILRELHPNIYNALVVGIIIGKSKPRIFNKPRNKEEESRGVIRLTIRDSLQDYINVTCWNTGEALIHIDSEFHIGDIIEIITPRIEIRKANDFGEQYRPMVTSPYTLTVNEPMTQIVRHEGNTEFFQQLLAYPTKPLAGFVTLANILNSSNTNTNNFVDILVAIRSIGDTRTVTTKSGVQLPVRDIYVFDHTNPGMKITFWEPEYIRKADEWKPRQTILFMTDMRVEYNNFMKCRTAALSLKTIITENPVGQAAENLRTYASDAILQAVCDVNAISLNLINVEAIQNVMTIGQVLDKIETKKNLENASVEDQQFSCLLYVVVTQLDLDGYTRILSRKCARCKGLVNSDEKNCTTEDCPVAMQLETVVPETSFDMRLQFTDHTGSLGNCRLQGAVAENALGCTAYDFVHMNETQKLHLKWRYLLERCSIRINILCLPGKNPIIQILSMGLASASEVANKLPHF